MNKTQTLARLKALGTAQNRKVYGSHGVTGAMFGVSYANLGKLRKEIKVDHKLAEQLWASRNHDARVLATMIADSEQMTTAVAQSIGKVEVDHGVTGCKTPDAIAYIKKAVEHRKALAARHKKKAVKKVVKKAPAKAKKKAAKKAKQKVRVAAR